MQLDKRQEDLLTLAEKGGRDAELLLLDKIHAIEDQLAELKQSIASNIDVIKAIEIPAPQITVNAPQGDQGEKGEKGDKGDPGKNGLDGRAGLDGIDGEDGQDAEVNEDAIVSKVLAQIPKPDLKGELDQFRSDISEQIKGIPEKPGGFQIFGPGKTRIITLDLSPQLNGVLKTFYVGTHFGIVGVESSSAPFGSFRPTTDFTETGKNIVFTSGVDASVSLASGQSLIVRYLR